MFVLMRNLLYNSLSRKVIYCLMLIDYCSLGLRLIPAVVYNYSNSDSKIVILTINRKQRAVSFEKPICMLISVPGPDLHMDGENSKGKEDTEERLSMELRFIVRPTCNKIGHFGNVPRANRIWLNTRKEQQELIRRWDSERELFYKIAHVEASAYAHWTSS